MYLNQTADKLVNLIDHMNNDDDLPKALYKGW